MNRSLFFVFFSILASLSLITGCAEKPAENTERVNKVELTDYQNSFAAAEKNLYQNGLNIHVSYENKKMSGINIIPTDFSRRAGERIQSLEKYISFIDEALSKYVGKKVKFEGDYESIITDEEKNILNQSKLEAQKLIKHYQSVLRYQNNEDFLHHDEYEDLVGDYLKKAKKTLADLEKKKGVVFSPPYIDKTGS